MSVIRVNHERNYVVLQKECLENSNISLKAKGLWAYCLSKPDHWEFHINQLVDSVKEGRDSIRSAMEELIKYGYCIRTQNKDDLGKWTTVDYEIFETSQLKKCLPRTGFPQTGFPLTDNPPLVSNDRKVSNDLRNTSSSSNEAKKETSSLTPHLKKEDDDVFKNCSQEQRAEALKRYKAYKEREAMQGRVIACPNAVLKKIIETMETESKLLNEAESAENIVKEKDSVHEKRIALFKEGFPQFKQSHENDYIDLTLTMEEYCLFVCDGKYTQILEFSDGDFFGKLHVCLKKVKARD